MDEGLGKAMDRPPRKPRLAPKQPADTTPDPDWLPIKAVSSGNELTYAHGGRHCDHCDTWLHYFHDDRANVFLLEPDRSHHYCRNTARAPRPI